MYLESCVGVWQATRHVSDCAEGVYGNKLHPMTTRAYMGYLAHEKAPLKALLSIFVDSTTVEITSLSETTMNQY